MTRNRLYFFLFTACAVGFIWITINYKQGPLNEGEPCVCLFKRITKIPCPSCGSTRSVVSLLKGDIIGAVMWNPLGIILLTLLVLTPIWIFGDLLGKKSTLFIFYNKSEHFFRRKWVATSAILIVLLNWIWNIYKGV